jgi:hypothetical protein
MQSEEYLKIPLGQLPFDIGYIPPDTLENEIQESMQDAEFQAQIIENIANSRNRFDAIFQLNDDTQAEVLSLVSSKIRNEFIIEYCRILNWPFKVQDFASC